MVILSPILPNNDPEHTNKEIWLLRVTLLSSRLVTKWAGERMDLEVAVDGLLRVSRISIVFGSLRIE
ncbi:hypothetical protein OLEAN_C26290 [Oleispira antarctica RB-8]|uniref:Uncharacterized protein n=1 Tax=Oleispira antarctica RB-8 TaxID=698738 RepID=R4YPH0_OLEAN|nr:hypothetical protein OLEAN_C26290 [Oleispira antarctica RB-8]